jgi:ATP-dependent helicase HrpA
MLKEKTQLLLKSLPQKLRRHCVPLPDYAAGFAERMRFGDGSLVDALVADIREQTQVVVKPADFKLETLPAHLFMNFKVVDEHGRQLAMGRNLAQLRGELGSRAQLQFQRIAAGAAGAALADARQGATHGGEQPRVGGAGRAAGEATARQDAGSPGAAGAAAGDAGARSTALYENLTTWNFGKLPELLEIQRGGQTLFGYPALVDRGTHCDVEVFDAPEEAERIHRHGLRRLFALQLREPIKYLEKNLPGLREMSMQYMAIGTQEELRDQLIAAALDRACLQAPWPDDDASFATRRDEGKGRLSLLAQEIARLVGQILA